MSERASQQANERKRTTESSSIVACLMLDCRTFMNSAHITWLAYLPTSQPSTLPKSTFAIDWMCQVTTCANAFMRTCIMAKGITKYLAHTQTHTQITANAITRSVEKEKELKYREKKTDSMKERRYRTRVLVCKKKSEKRREGEYEYKLIYVCTVLCSVHGCVNCQYALLLFAHYCCCVQIKTNAL